MNVVIEMDTGGLVKYWNRHAEWVFGYNAHEALGKPLHVLVFPPSTIASLVQGEQTIFNAQSIAVTHKRLQVSAQRRNQEVYPAVLVVSAYNFNQSSHYCTYIGDITE